MGRPRTVEEYAARRGRMVLLATVLFVVYSVIVCRVAADPQIVWATAHGPSNSLLQLITWLAWAVVVCLHVFGTLPILRWTPAQRRVLHDEFTQVIRVSATRWGFGVLLSATVVHGLSSVLHVWLPPLWWPLAATSAALTAAGLRFAIGDLRADG